MNELITVRIQNPLWPYRERYDYVPPFAEFTGRLMPNPSWVTSDSFCLSTGDENFPFRIIQKDSIECAWLHSETQESQSSFRTYEVMKNGKKYVVTFDRNKFTCTCTGFSYRRTCSHIEGVMNDT